MRKFKNIIIHLLDVGCKPYGTFVLKCNESLEEELCIKLVAEASKAKMLMAKRDEDTISFNLITIDTASMKSNIVEFLSNFKQEEKHFDVSMN